MKLCLINILVLLCIIARAQDMSFSALTTVEGLPDNIVTKVYKDSYGDLWVGTKNGLAVFDGADVRLIHEAPLETAFVSSIAEDDQGDIYIGTYYHGVIKYVRDSALFKPFFSFPNSYSVSKILCQKDTVAIASLAGGMVILDRSAKVLLSLNSAVSQPRLASDVITDFLFDKGKLVIVYDVDVVEFLDFKTGRLSRIELSDKKEGNFYGFGKKIKKYNRNSFLVCSEETGVYFLKENTVYKHLTAENSDLSSNFVTDVEIVDDSLVFIGTDGHGLNICNLNSGQFRHYSAKYIPHGSIRSNAIYDILYDNGIVWLGTYQAGLNYANILDNSVMNVLNLNEQNASYTNNSVLSVCSDASGAIWMGTDGAGLKKIGTDYKVAAEYFMNSSDSALVSNVVKTVYSDSEDHLWLGFYAKGIQIVGQYPSGYEEIMDYLSGQSIWAMTENSNGDLWFGTLNDGLVCFSVQKNEITHYHHNVNEPSSLIDNQILSLMANASGEVWVGTDGAGVCVYDTVNKMFQAVELGVESSLIIAGILQVNDSVVWVADAKKGIFAVNAQTKKVIRHLSSKNLLPSDRVFGLASGNNDEIWIACQQHICRYIHDSLTVIGASNGLKVMNFNASSINWHNGRLIAGGTNGFAVIDMREVKENEIVPVGEFVSLKVNAVEIEPNKQFNGEVLIKQPIYVCDSVVLPPEINSFSLRFVCRNSKTVSGCKFRYRLQGMDDGYVNFTSNSKIIRYNNVKGGAYKLVVEYAKGNQWKMVKQISVTVKLSFFERKLVRAGLVLLIIFLFVATIYTVFRVKERQRLNLEIRVRERTQEVFAQKESLLEKQQRLEAVNKKVLQQKESLEKQQKELIASHSQIEKSNAVLQERSEYLHDMNEEMQTQNEKIFEQTEALQTKNELLTKSLNYARRIQNTLFPSEVGLKHTIPNSFLFFSPKEIVSGDFYWLRIVDNITVLAVVDCTGHGVPGAFMSMIGNALLNEIVVNRKIVDPQEVLYCLNDELIRIFNVGDFDMEAQDDGMDITVCALADEEIKVASAMQNFYVYADDQVKVFNGDIFSIGGLMAKFKSPVYTSYTFPRKQGMSIFMCSDGIVDQFGGIERKKFGVERLVTLLNKAVLYSADDRKKVIEEDFTEWLGENEQMDDVILVGLEF